MEKTCGRGYLYGHEQSLLGDLGDGMGCGLDVARGRLNQQGVFASPKHGLVIIYEYEL